MAKCTLGFCALFWHPVKVLEGKEQGLCVPALWGREGWGRLLLSSSPISIMLLELSLFRSRDAARFFTGRQLSGDPTLRRRLPPAVVMDTTPRAHVLIIRWPPFGAGSSELPTRHPSLPPICRDTHHLYIFSPAACHMQDTKKMGFTASERRHTECWLMMTFKKNRGWLPGVKQLLIGDAERFRRYSKWGTRPCWLGPCFSFLLPPLCSKSIFCSQELVGADAAEQTQVVNNARAFSLYFAEDVRLAQETVWSALIKDAQLFCYFSLLRSFSLLNGFFFFGGGGGGCCQKQSHLKNSHSPGQWYSLFYKRTKMHHNTQPHSLDAQIPCRPPTCLHLPPISPTQSQTPTLQPQV